MVGFEERERERERERDLNFYLVFVMGVRERETFVNKRNFSLNWSCASHMTLTCATLVFFTHILI